MTHSPNSHLKRLTQGASATEKAALFSGSAAWFYRLDLATLDAPIPGAS
jgi:hypothetical protein